MGGKNALVDIALGVVERLYVSDGAPATQVSRRRKVATPTPATPSWDQVLYRGAAATATGEHLDGEGAFKILATPPVAPLTHNRRESDRSGSGGREPQKMA